MNDDVKAFFSGLAARGYDGRLHGANGTVEFDVDDGGTWRVMTADGWVTVEEGPGKADCSVACGVDDFLAAVRGEKTASTLLLQGRSRITGDLALGEVVQRLFPAPDMFLEHPERTLSHGPMTEDQSWSEGDF
jgi:predicted lipid carrier protein YhbT